MIFFHKWKELRHDGQNIGVLHSSTPGNSNLERIDEGDRNMENYITPVIPRITSRKRYAHPETKKKISLRKPDKQIERRVGVTVTYVFIDL